MGCPQASFVAFGILCILLAFMVISVRWGSAPTTSGFFKNWRDVLAALREAREWEEKFLIYALAVAQIFRTGGWGVVGITAVAGFPAVGAICWDVPGIIRAIGDVLESIFERLSVRKAQSL